MIFFSLKNILIIFAIIIIFFLFWFYRKRGRFENTVGHVYNETAREALEDALKNKDPENMFKAAEIINYNIGNPQEAEFFYITAIEFINNNPEAAINQQIEPETIIDRAEQQIGRQENARQIIRNTRKGARKVKIRSDPQNVHDSNVSVEIKEKIIKLFELTDGLEFSKPVLTEKQQKIYEEMQNKPAEFCGTTDAEIFNRSWAYSKNKELRSSLAESLENFYQENYRICVMGRVSNIIDSFTLLDDELGKPILTVELLRKRCFELAAEIAKKDLTDEEKKNEIDRVLRLFLKNKHEDIINEAKAGV